MVDGWAFVTAAYARGGGGHYDHCRYEGCISGILSAFLVLIVFAILCVLIGLGFNATRQKMLSLNWKPMVHVGGVAIGSLLLIGSMFAGTVTFIFACAALIGLGIGYLKRR